MYFFSEQNVAKELQQQQRREINAVLEQKTLPIFWESSEETPFLITDSIVFSVVGHAFQHYILLL